jgi:hypothetical protein
MEAQVIAASVFIPLAIIAVTQFIKYLAPKVNGAVTIAVAVVLGIVIALVDVLIGIADITVAQGIVYALGAVGITTTAQKLAGKG